MPLINLQTDLKSLKYGKDRKGGGDSGQPYIKSNIPDGLTSSSPDFLLRNGYLNPISSANDVSRLTQMFFDLKSPNGFLFTAKQNLLSRTSPKTQTSGILNGGVYNPLSTLSQAGVVSVGGHLNKQGTDPFELTGAYSNNDNLYGVRVKYTQPTEENRLNKLYNDYITVKNESINILSYPGGPGSNLGIGNTNIKFASPEQRTGVNNPEGNNILNNNYQTTRYNNRVSLTKSPLGVSIEWFDTTKQNDFVSYPPLTTNGGYTFELNTVTSVYSPKAAGTFPTTTERIYDNNTFTYNQQDIIDTEVNLGKLNGSPSTQDFRAILRNKLQGTQKTNAEQRGATPITPNYTLKNIENRVLLGDPGNRTNKNLSSYTKGSGIGPVDKINALSIYKSSAVDTKKEVNDLVKFRIAAIDNDTPNFKTFMHFRALIDSFSDSYTGEWNGTKYLGRGENFYNYTGFNRTISLSWKVVAQSKEELIPMHKKLNYLASNLMPDYSNSGYMRGPLLQLTVGGYLYEQVGFFTSLTYTIPQDSPWEIGINDSGGSDNSVKELSQMIDVQASFTPIHNFVPAKQTLTFDNTGITGYGPERFIALSAGTNKTDNNYDS
jgi:hypothetical protein